MSESDLALVLSGGGARAAYQVGFLRHLASRHPDLASGILTGVSAGGIIAICLASREGRFCDSVAQLDEQIRLVRSQLNEEIRRLVRGTGGDLTIQKSLTEDLQSVCLTTAEGYYRLF